MPQPPHRSLLLSSYGVLGRVVFLARQERVRRSRGRALRRAMLRADDESDEDEDEDEDEHPASSGGVSGAVAKAAIMAPAARFLAPSAGPEAEAAAEYERYLRAALLAHHRLGWCIVDGVDPESVFAAMAAETRARNPSPRAGAESAAGASAGAMTVAAAAATAKRRKAIEALLADLDVCPRAKLEKEHGEALKAQLLAERSHPKL